MGLLERLNRKWDETYFADIRDDNNDVMKTISEMIDAADAVVIGAGSGLSTAAGLTYGGKRFEEHFSDFIQKYGMTDMYSAGFYPFQSQEEKWAYWSKHIYYNRYDIAPLKAYTDLLDIVKDKDYFVLTTNVDAQFVNAGFDKQRIFATQGDYGKLQCAHACHKKLYDNEQLVRKMLSGQENCKIEAALVPKCPVCGGEMEVNLRCDQYFVEDDAWDEANERYHAFLKAHEKKHTIYLELGVGMNTPGIIKYPFWQMTYKNKNAFYICLNKGQAWTTSEIEDQSIVVDVDIADAFSKIREIKNAGKYEICDKENEFMDQEDRLDYIVEALKKDSIRYKDLEVPRQERRKIMRSLMNIRMPKQISPDFLRIQDEFLQEEAVEKEIVSLHQIPTVKMKYQSMKPQADKISIWQGDITRLAVDAIVNAANSQMLGCFVPCHACIDNAIHSAAGIELREACNQYMVQKRKEDPMYEEPTGRAMVTPGFNLPANYVIHTVGPIVQWKVTDRLRQDLKNCYTSCLMAALEKGIRSIAFCCISTGEFHYPNEEAAEIAVETVTEFLKEHEGGFDRVIFNVFKDLDKEIYESIFA